MVTAHFTWLGPPQAANKQVIGEGAARPDLFGLERTARARFEGSGAPPSFTLCCLKKYETRFRNQLPDHIDVLAVEDAFPATRDFRSIQMSKPDLTDLDMCVDFIMREIIGVRGMGYPDSALPYKMLAFAKDIWSLYCVWKRGGYHIDCGCFPDAKYGGLVKLPDPTTFGVPVVSGTGKTPLHCSVRFPASWNGGPCCSTLCGGWASSGGAVAQVTLGSTVAAKGNGVSHMNRQVDVWLLRAPQGDPTAETALKFYIMGWFAMRDNKFLDPQSHRELVVASVATAITHAGAKKCKSATEWTSHLIEADGGDVPSLGLRKVGFQSHAG